MALDELQIGGLGARRKRVEDARFVRGKGNYVDDFVRHEAHSTGWEEGTQRSSVAAVL